MVVTARCVIDLCHSTQQPGGLGGTKAAGGHPMCLAIPMKIVRIDGMMAVCEARGIVRMASLFLFQDDQLTVGDYVLLQSGHITARVTCEEAQMTWRLYDEILSADALPRGAV
jgi:hydrogenase expression/formation protein HypC